MFPRRATKLVFEKMRLFAMFKQLPLLSLLTVHCPPLARITPPLQQILKLDPEASVIATSGYNESEAMQIFGASIAGFIQKPYTAPELGRKMKAACQRAVKSAAAGTRVIT